MVVTPDADYTLSKVTVNGDSNLTAGNIKSGAKIFGVTGTYNNAKPEQTKTVDLSMASGNQVVSPDNGKVLSSVTITKPSTLVAENIKKDVNIGGVVGTLESGGSGEMVSFTATSAGPTLGTPQIWYCSGESVAQLEKYKTPVQCLKNSAIISVGAFSKLTGLIEIAALSQSLYIYQITDNATATHGF